VTRSSLAAFAAGNAVGLIGVIASARRAVPADSISVATAASPSKRSGLVPTPKILSMEFSLNPHSRIAAQRIAPPLFIRLFTCGRSQD
jgi:hypothetical protein